MARNFNGSNYYTITSGLPSLTNLTLSIWFNMGSLANAYTGLIGRDDGSGELYQILIKSTGHLAYYQQNAGGGPNVDPGAGSVSTGAWHHAAMTVSISGGNVTLTGYLDGVSDGTSTVLGSAGNAGNFYIGNDDFANRSLTGSLADATLWNVALTSLEITALAKGERPPTIRPRSLVCYVPLFGLTDPEPEISGNKLTVTTNSGPISSTFGPPIGPLTPRWPQIIPTVGASSSAVFRRTLSEFGTRGGSRQMHS